MERRKKMYVKPSVKVFDLKQEPQLLVGSGGLGSPNPFNNGGNPLSEG